MYYGISNDRYVLYSKLPMLLSPPKEFPPLSSVPLKGRTFQNKIYDSKYMSYMSKLENLNLNLKG